MADGTIEIALEIDDSGTDRQARTASTRAGRLIAKGLNDTVRRNSRNTGKEVGEDLEKGVVESGTKAGTSFGTRFSAALNKINTGSSAVAGLRMIEQQSERVGTALTNYVTKPAGLAATAVAGIVIGAGWNRLVAIDTARGKLTALGHDAQSIENIMNSANESVLGTSYSLADASTAAAGAVAAGVQQGDALTGYLKNVGDAAAVAGTSFSDMASIFNRVQTAGRAYTMELNMLADRGIPIFEWLAEAAGVSTEEIRNMAQQGEISSQMYFDAIERNIGGAAKIIGETTFMGAFENVQAAIGRIGAAFLDAGGQGGGFFSQLQPLLRDFITLLDESKDDAAELGEIFGGVFADVIGVLGDAINWFRQLTPQQKESAIQFAAMAVAAGPLLRIFSRLVGGLATLGSGITTVNGAFKILGGKTVKDSDKSLRLLKGAASVAKGALAGLAVAGIAVLIAEFVRLDQYQKNYVKATEGLIDSSRVLSGASLASGDAFRIQSQRAEEAGRKIGDIKPNIDNLLASQAALADSLRENNLQAQSSINELEYYQTTIDNLAFSSNLTADEQAALQLAVQGVNDILGTAYQVTDDYTGKIYEQKDVEGELRDVYLESTEALDNLIDAKQREIEIEASRANTVQLLNAQAEANDELAKAIIAEDEALQKFNETEYINAESRAYANGEVLKAEKATDDARGAVEAATIALENEEFRMLRLQQATEGVTTELGSFLANQDLLNSIVETNGYSLEEFQNQLENTGYTTQQLESLSGPALEGLAKAYDGSIDSIIGYLEDLGIEAPNLASEAASNTVDQTEGELRKLPPAAETIGNDSVSALTDPFFTADPKVRGFVDSFLQEVNPLVEGMGQAGANAVSSLNWSFESYDAAPATGVANKAVGAIAPMPFAFSTTGQTAVNSFDSPMQGYTASGAISMRNRAMSEVAKANARPAGTNFGLGYSGGMISSTVLNSIASAGARIVNAAMASVNKAQRSASPSRLAMIPGGWFTQGYGLGIEEETEFAVRKVDDMVRESLGALDSQVLSTRVLYGSDLYDRSVFNGSAGGNTVIYQLNIDGVPQNMRQDVQTQVKEYLEYTIRRA